MTLAEMQARLRTLNNEAQAIIDAADKTQNGEFTDEQQKKFDELTAEMDSLSAGIERATRRQENAARLGNYSTSLGRQIAPAQPKSDETNRLEQTFGFESMGEYAQAVYLANPAAGSRFVIDERLANIPNLIGAPSNFHRESGSSDGYMVPPQYRDQIFDLMFVDENLLSMTDSEPTDSNSVEFLSDETTPWSANGIQAYWRSEGSQMTPSRLATKAETLKLHELYAFVTATEELLEDAPRLTNRLTVKAPQAIRFKADESIVTGTGAGQPLGFLNANYAGRVTVAAESGQAAATINSNNLSKMYSRILPSSLGRSVWLANTDVMEQLMHLTIGNQPIWTPFNAGFKAAPGGLLLGRPIVFTEHAPALGTEGDLMLADMKGYYSVFKKSGLKFADSLHLFFDYNVHAFRWTFRLGGQPYLRAPVSPYKGSNTKGHFVTLATRS